MDANFQELTAKAGKLNIDSKNPKYSTNWCDIPMEMRAECIKYMDLKTRMRLRRTSKTEKSLVQSAKKYFLKQFMVSVRLDRAIVTTIENGLLKECHEKPKNNERVMRNVVNILEHCEIDIFQFFTDEENDKQMQPICDFRIKDAPFRFETFYTSSNNAQILKFFLGNCEGVEEVILNNRRMENVMDTLVEFPSVINAKLILYLHLRHMDCQLFELFKKWIDNDAEIGKKLLFALRDKNDKPIELFASIFEDRIISKSNESVRIRTNNPSKHVILKCDISYPTASYYTCTIIPSDLRRLPREWGWTVEFHSMDFDYYPN